MYDRVDVILLSKLASNTAVGIYGLPYKLYASLQILPFGIFGTILPRLSRSDWKVDTQQMMSRVLNLLFNVSLLIVLVVILFGAPAIQLALGDAYEGSAIALKILILGLRFQCFSWIRLKHGPFGQSTGKHFHRQAMYVCSSISSET